MNCRERNNLALVTSLCLLNSIDTIGLYIFMLNIIKSPNSLKDLALSGDALPMHPDSIHEKNKEGKSQYDYALSARYRIATVGEKAFLKGAYDDTRAVCREGRILTIQKRYPKLSRAMATAIESSTMMKTDQQKAAIHLSSFLDVSLSIDFAIDNLPKDSSFTKATISDIIICAEELRTLKVADELWIETEY